ncbi:MAG: M14 family metallopeptidase [Chloroflexota bacterium]
MESELTAEIERVDVTRFYTYDELTAILNRYVEAFPELASLESIGQSYEGRDIWALTITNSATGPAADKPAMYIDANIHAGEVTGCSVVLYTADTLLHGYGTDDRITYLLDTRTFYLLPRVQPDGVEKYLTTPEMLRSSVRQWPFDYDDEGLTPEDINDDGLILQMRVPDQNGEWRASNRDPRLMVKRGPDEFEGEFYRLYTEGMINDYDGGPVRFARPRYGLDQNRNWPAQWSVHQRGGGPYPLSEPETQAVAKFVEGHRNISIVQNYHTAGGVILRAPCAVGDDALPPRDAEIYADFGAIGEDVTGYPCSPVYNAFPRRDDAGRRSTAGGFIEWTYDHLGIWSFATELWDIQSRAGIERPKDDPMRSVREPTEDDGLKLLTFLDEELDGEGFVPWQRFDHPQLGQVEIGGWNIKFMRQNAPPKFLQDEAERNTAFTIRQAGMTPELGLENVEVEGVGGDLYIVRATVVNRGYLPTHNSWALLRNGTARPVELEIEGGEVLMGKRRQEIGHLAGRSGNRGMMPMFGMSKVDNERRVEWLVRGTGPLTVHARSEKAGAASETVDLA